MWNVMPEKRSTKKRCPEKVSNKFAGFYNPRLVPLRRRRRIVQENCDPLGGLKYKRLLLKSLAS